VAEETKTIPVEFAFARAAEATPVTPEPGVIRRLGAYNEKFLLVQNQLAKDWVGTAHSHPHDQAVYVVSGRIRVVCAGETVELCGGDSFVVAGGVVHQVTALEDSAAVDLFAPCRQEFLT
jgi:quercetin dioxygenase-like cupin family protein